MWLTLHTVEDWITVLQLLIINIIWSETLVLCFSFLAFIWICFIASVCWILVSISCLYSAWVSVCMALSWRWFPVSIPAVPSVYTIVAALLPCPLFAGEALRLTAMVMELVPYLWPCPGLQTSLFPWDHPPLAIASWSLFLLAVKVIQLPLHPLLVFCWF